MNASPGAARRASPRGAVREPRGPRRNADSSIAFDRCPADRCKTIQTGLASRGHGFPGRDLLEAERMKPSPR